MDQQVTNGTEKYILALGKYTTAKQVRTSARYKVKNTCSSIISRTDQRRDEPDFIDTLINLDSTSFGWMSYSTIYSHTHKITI